MICWIYMVGAGFFKALFLKNCRFQKNTCNESNKFINTLQPSLLSIVAHGASKGMNLREIEYLSI